MRAFEQRLSDLLLDVYESASNPKHWATFLENAAREMDASKAALHVHYFAPDDTIQTAQGSCAVSIGYDASSLTDYANYYATQDLYVQRIRERFPVGAQVGTSADLLTASEYRRTELYQDFSRPNGVFHNCWSICEQSESLAAGFGFIRPEDTKPFGAKDVSLLKLLNPHLSKAFQLQRVIAEATGENTALLASVAQLDFGVIAVGPDGKVTNLSAPAKRILDERDGICLRSGRLEVAVHAENNKLQRMLMEARNPLDGRMEAGGTTMLVSRGGRRRPLQISVFPFVSGALVFDPSAQPVSRAAVVQDLYGLTPTEARLADLLLHGMEVRKCAEKMGITLGTARFHVKRVLAKTGARKQSELIQLMFSLPGQG